MAVLITGATGRLGSLLTSALIRSGATVNILTRRPHRALELFGNRVNGFEWHPRTEPLPEGALDGVRRIVHLMGEPIYGRPTRRKFERIVSSRRLVSERLLEALGERPAHLIVASSAAVYGPGPGLPVTEEAPPAKPVGRLAAAARAWERAAEFARENGSIVTLVRLGLVIGTDAFPDALLPWFERGLAWRSAGPDAVVPVIDGADAVALLYWLVHEREIDGPVNAVAPVPLLASDLMRVLAEAAATPTRVSLPRWMVRRKIGLAADLLTFRHQIVPKRALDAGFGFAHPDPVESLKAVLSHRPRRRARGLMRLGGLLQRS
jgi:uncharacterized protein (TIGR01777 family)